jgi:hypothetical protein
VPAAPSSAATRSCGEIARQGENRIELETVRATGVGCRTARFVLTRHTRGRTTAGWQCNSAGNEARCTRGQQVASYREASRVRRCGRVGFAPQSDSGAFGIAAKRASCGKARAVARGSRSHGPTPGASHRYRAEGFRCRGFLRDETLPSVLYTCRRGARTIAFSRS